jgi:hypothetical protein
LGFVAGGGLKEGATDVGDFAAALGCFTQDGAGG